MGWVKKRVNPSGKVVWRAGYTDPTGRRVTGTFEHEGGKNNRPKGAWDWVRDQEAKAASPDWIDPELGAVSLAAFWAESVEQRDLKPSSRADVDYVWAKWIGPYIGGEALRELQTEAAMDAWFAAIRRDGCPPATQHKALRNLRPVLGRAVKKGRITRNPLSGYADVRMPRPREVRVIDDAQVWALADAVGRRGRPEGRLRALVPVLAYGGLRVGEGLALEVGDFDAARGVLHVCKTTVELGGRISTGPTKTYGVRDVPLPPTVRDELVAHLANPKFVADPKDRSALIFCTRDGGHLSENAVLRRFVRPAAEAVGLAPGFSTHWLRHTCASLLVRAGWSVVAVSQHLGHSSPTVTLNVYSHFFKSDTEELVDRTEAGIRKARSASADVVPITAAS